MKNFFAAALLTTTCLLILGWFDHHAAEYDPQHTHLAPGLLGIALDLRTLPHAHAFAVDHRHETKAGPPQVLVSGTKTVVTAAVSLHPTGDKASKAASPASAEMAAYRRQMDAIVPFSSLWYLVVDLEVLDPPPRSV